MSNKILQYLLSIVKRGNSLSRTVIGLTEEDLIAETDKAEAVIARLYKIADTMKRLRDELNFTLDGIDFNGISGFRNVLAHEYNKLEATYIVKIATVQVPLLVAKIITYLHDNGIDTTDVGATLDSLRSLYYLLIDNGYTSEQFNKYVDSIYNSATSELKGSSPCRYSVAAQQFQKWHEAQLRLKG
jgi:uncharacterized protein with HEPN domain